MESPSEQSQIIEKAIKDLSDHWDKEDREQFGQRFKRYFNLDCDSRWVSQIEKLIGRNLTPEEKDQLNSYYILICLIGPAPQLRNLGGVEERIHQLQEELQNLEEIRQLHLDLRRLTNRFDN